MYEFMMELCQYPKYYMLLIYAIENYIGFENMKKLYSEDSNKASKGMLNGTKNNKKSNRKTKINKKYGFG